MKNILNHKQLEAVNTIKNPLLIIAGPGTGKTKILVERVVNILVKEKVQAKKIMLTTFTNKAARELEFRINERLEQIGENIDISEMYLGTMHSIWIRLIQENIKHSRFFDNFYIISSDYEQHFFIYSRLKEYKKIDGYQEVFKNLSIYESWKISGFIRKKINDLNENAIIIKELRTKDKYILFLKEVYKLYEKQLIEENCLDYSFIQTEILNMLKNEIFLEKINNNIDYIMVDEYQDSNKVQEKILLLLSKNKKNICVVGDEDQSIYRFRGASSENILKFPKYFDESKSIVLDKNYRSTEEIVKFCSRWINSIEWKGNRFEKEFYSGRIEDILANGVLNISGKTLDENIRNTVNFIKRLKKSKKITNYNQIAVLFSSFKGLEAKKLEEFLQKEDIKVYSPRTKDFFESIEIKLSFGIILACFKEYIIKKNDYLKECLNLARYNAKKDENLLKWIVSKREKINEINLESLNNIFYDFFQFDFYKNILENPALKDSKEFYNLSVLSKIFKSFQKYVKYKKINVENSFATLVYFFEKYIFLLRKQNIGNIYQTEENYPDNTIPFLTIHQSKGLEFPVVIVFSLGNKPYYNKDENINSIDRLLQISPNLSEEDKEKFDFYRKFYVAFSRAKNLLVLSSSTKNLSENFKPHFYSTIGVNSLNFDINNLNLDKITEKKEKQFLSFTTDINLFRICPQKYFFIRKKKMETYEMKNLNIGKIVHKIIEHLNKRIIEYRISQEIEKVEKLFTNNYIKNLIEKIYKFERLEMDENLYKIFNLVKNYLLKQKENFQFIKKAEFSEYRVEEDFILYGELDLLLENEANIEIVDFKTGRKKEETFGTYREQLSFYKILLQKKYPQKNIKTFLYYLEEDEAKIEIKISEEELIKDYENIKITAKDILKENFEKKKFEKNICENCEFKKNCWK